MTATQSCPTSQSDSVGLRSLQHHIADVQDVTARVAYRSLAALFQVSVKLRPVHESMSLHINCLCKCVFRHPEALSAGVHVCGGGEQIPMSVQLRSVSNRAALRLRSADTITADVDSVQPLT